MRDGWFFHSSHRINAMCASDWWFSQESKTIKTLIRLSIQKTSTLDIPKSIKPDNLSVNRIICISEPDDDNPRTPLTPETIERTPDEKSNAKNQLTPTITEENELDEQMSNNKSSLSLPVEPPLSGPIERDRRKLSVQGLMAFAERRRSSSTFSDMRKMSVSNGDGIHIRSPGGVGMFSH